MSWYCSVKLLFAPTMAWTSRARKLSETLGLLMITSAVLQHRARIPDFLNHHHLNLVEIGAFNPAWLSF